MKRKVRKAAVQVGRILIPAAILFFIFKAIDWSTFLSVLDQSDPFLVFAGVSYYPLVILLGAMRWNTMLRVYHGARVRFTASVKDYWSGMAIGVFAPASLGWDVYRVTLATRRYGGVVANSATILLEKVMALLTCAALVTLLVPFMDIAPDNRDLQQVIKITHLILVGTLFVLATAFLMARHEATIRFLKIISAKVVRLLNQLSEGSNAPAGKQTSLAAVVSPLRRLNVLIPITVFSLLIQVASAVGNQIFFIAVNHDLPLLVNLFVVPVLYFIFLLPISFGSVGIREGAYILLYGAFGVPIETALLVSFFNFFGILSNNLVGAIMLALNPDHLRPPQSR